MNAKLLPTLDRVANFRELSGYKGAAGRRVAAGRLYRSGHWGHASEDDRAALADLGVGLVIDFRSDNDIRFDGEDRLPDGVEHLRLPMGDPAGTVDVRDLFERGSIDEIRAQFGNGGAEAMMLRAAASMVTKRCEHFAAFLDRLSNANAPTALFHCSAGKDRAGWAGSIVLLALGVDEEDVIEEYQKSNAATQQIADRASGSRSYDVGDLLKPMIEVRREYALCSLAAAREGYGSVAGYLRDGLGLCDERRDQLRENLLEPA